MRRPWGSTGQRGGPKEFSKSLGLLTKSSGGKGDSLGFGKRRRETSRAETWSHLHQSPKTEVEQPKKAALRKNNKKEPRLG